MKINTIMSRINQIDKKDLNYVKPDAWFNRKYYQCRGGILYLLKTPLDFVAKMQASKLIHNEFMSRSLASKNKHGFILFSNNDIDNALDCLG